MFSLTPDQVWPFFFGTMVVLAIGGTFVYHSRKVGAALKKWLFIISNATAAILFIFYGWVMNGWSPFLFFGIFIVAVGAALRIAVINFCPFCNSAVNSRSKVCRSCGHALDETPL